MKKIAVMTSGGDAPGMNAALRAVVRNATSKGYQVWGIQRAYCGLMAGELTELNNRSVSNIIQRGGTMIKTARSEEYKTPEGREKAKQTLERFGIDGLIVIGGDGSFRGACDLEKIWQGQIIGVPGTIDNDLVGTDFTIGYDTAINTAMEAIDKIRDTAAAHDRFFLIEVMGRHAGFIALETGIAGGAEAALLPETQTDIDLMCADLARSKKAGKLSSIIVVAEGDDEGDAFEVARKISEVTGEKHHVAVLGHIQRGGVPTARDRILATKLGAYAVDLIEEGKSGVMSGEIGGQLVATPLEATWNEKKPLDPYLLKIFPILAS